MQPTTRRESALTGAVLLLLCSVMMLTACVIVGRAQLRAARQETLTLLRRAAVQERLSARRDVLARAGAQVWCGREPRMVNAHGPAQPSGAGVARGRAARPSIQYGSLAFPSPHKGQGQ